MGFASEPNEPDPTRASWLEEVRPSATRIILELWRPEHYCCLITMPLRRLDRKGCLTSGIEDRDSRLKKFDSHWARIMTAAAARDFRLAEKLAQEPDFSHALRLAFSADDAITLFTEVLVSGNNAWSDGGGPNVLVINCWRE